VGIGLYERFPALRYRDFRLLWLGQMVSMAGAQMQTAALHWQLYELTRDPRALGLIGLARVVPILILSLAGGTLADALDRRRLIQVTQALLMGIAFLLGWLTHTGLLAAWMIYALSAIAAGANAFSNPARHALLPSLLPREHFANAVSLHAIVREIAAISGPPIAGFLIAAEGIAVVYWLNAVSFLGVIWAVAVMRVQGKVDNATQIDLEALREGIGFVRSNPILLSTMLLDFFATFFSSANTLLPIFAREILHVGPKGYGMLAAAPAAGSLLTGILLSSMRRVRRQGIVMLWAVAAYGMATLIFGLSPWFALSLAALAGTGAADTVSSVIRQTVRQLVTPDHLRGRISAVSMIFFMGGPQLGELEAGFVAAWVGAPLSVVLGGIGCLATVVIIARRVPKLREYEGE
jgi:MFS family permease